jgi:hypothetical protein
VPLQGAAWFTCAVTHVLKGIKDLSHIQACINFEILYRAQQSLLSLVLQNVTVVQVVKTFPYSNETRNLLPCSQESTFGPDTQPYESTPPRAHTIPLRSVLTLPSRMHMRLQCGSLPSYLGLKFCTVQVFTSHLRACICCASHPPGHMITGLIFVAGKIRLGVLKRQWEDDIKIYRTEVRFENMN